MQVGQVREKKREKNMCGDGDDDDDDNKTASKQTNERLGSNINLNRSTVFNGDDADIRRRDMCAVRTT